MARVVANMSVSLDGFVADPADGVAEVFTWYALGDTPVPDARRIGVAIRVVWRFGFALMLSASPPCWLATATAAW